MDLLQPRSTNAMMRAMVHWLVLVSLPLASAVAMQSQATDEAQVDARKLEFFESRIRPVLIEHCYECHGPNARILGGNLSLTSREGHIKGGDSGPVIIPGNPADSILLQSLRYESIEMPPSGKLGEAVQRDFETWIADGAVDPRNGTAVGSGQPASDPSTGETHWAFQKIQPVPVPDGSNPFDSLDPIDRFVEQRLALLHAAAPLHATAAPTAEPLVLLRRATFDLTGLPPTLDDVDAFMSDPPAERYERLLDRLLASPQYGIRWGRHWLDVVRYADSNGADENHDMPVAWRYRDWVVDALNEDLPWDAFVTQQLAGDLLTPPDDEVDRGRLLTATGFWVLGPKMLAEQDKAKMRIDIVDEQIDTFSRAMLGVTLACARCHDHKFDPFTQEDYYAMAGILMSTRTMADEAFVSKWMERPLPSTQIDQARAEHQVLIDAVKTQLAKSTADANQKLLQDSALESLPEDPKPLYSETTRAELEELARQVTELEKALPQPAMAMAVEAAPAIDLPVHIRGNHLRPGERSIERGVPKILTRSVPMEPLEPAQSGRLQLARWLTHPDHPLLARVMVNRVWMWHFGQGLVTSPSNFGLKGEAPSHPELLDYLASNWIANGWSLKWLHREIMMSQTYRRSSQAVLPSDIDPENRLLSKQNIQRLQVEPLRDAILQASDRLDLRLNGPGGQLDSPRRTLFLTINRAALPDLFSIFDYVDPASHIEQRSVTSVPSQALFLLNNDIVIQSSEALARRLLDRSSDVSYQIEMAFRITLAREPNAFELERSTRLLHDAAEDVSAVSSEDASRLAALSLLVRSLMATREFSWIE